MWREEEEESVSTSGAEVGTIRGKGFVVHVYMMWEKEKRREGRGREGSVGE